MVQCLTVLTYSASIFSARKFCVSIYYYYWRVGAIVQAVQNRKANSDSHDKPASCANDRKKFFMDRVLSIDIDGSC